MGVEAGDPSGRCHGAAGRSYVARFKRDARLEDSSRASLLLREGVVLGCPSAMYQLARCRIYSLIQFVIHDTTTDDLLNGSLDLGYPKSAALMAAEAKLLPAAVQLYREAAARGHVCRKKLAKLSRDFPPAQVRAATIPYSRWEPRCEVHMFVSDHMDREIVALLMARGRPDGPIRALDRGVLMIICFYLVCQPRPMRFVDAHLHLGRIGEDFFTLAAYQELVGSTEGPLVVVEADPDPMAELRRWDEILGEYEPVRYVAGINMLAEDLGAPGGYLETLCGSSPRVVGVRHILNYHPKLAHRTWPRVECYVERTAQFRSNLALLGEHRLTFDLQINYEQVTPQLCAILKENPSVKVCVDHMLLPQFEGPKEAWKGTWLGEEVWRAAIIQLSRIPHVYMKLSMTPFYMKQGDVKWWLDDALRVEVGAAVRFIIDRFGARRCMFASNAPVDQLHFGLPFATQLEAFCGWISEAERDQIGKATALEFYRFNSVSEEVSKTETIPMNAFQLLCNKKKVKY